MQRVGDALKNYNLGEQNYGYEIRNKYNVMGANHSLEEIYNLIKSKTIGIGSLSLFFIKTVKVLK